MPNRKLIRLAVISLMVLAAVGGSVAWWLHRRTYEATDNAYVQAETVSVTPQIDGYISEILVQDNQQVTVGQVLLRLDPADAQARLDQATAGVAAAGAAVRGVDDKAFLGTALINERVAAVVNAEAAELRAKQDMDRYAALAARGFATTQRVEEARAAAAQSSAAVVQAKAALEAERRAAGALGSSRSQMQAQALAAQASASKARTDLERTVIRAPVTGVVGARAVRPGQYVRPGGALLAIVPLGDTFVVANFKETQVAKLRIGQRVEIRADAFGQRVIRGRIESFAPATGSEFALIPVENAVGNFTKIAQRLPVRIAIDPGGLPRGALRPGLSLKVKVDVTDRSGLSFAEAVSGRTRAAAGSAAAPAR